MSFEIDRNPSSEPSLREMSEKALKLLLEETKASTDKGFFLMIEGSRIDMAAHNNDAAAHYRDIVAYQETVAFVEKFVKENPNTVMISVSDHETGGLTLGKQLDPLVYPEYLWHPQPILAAKRSVEYLTAQIFKNEKSRSRGFIVQNIINLGLGISNATNAEIDELMKAVLTRNPAVTMDILGKFVSNRSLIGWTTHGHTGVDVNLYAYGYQHLQLTGNRENTDIGHFIARVMQLDLVSITRKLRNNNETSLKPEQRENNDDKASYKRLHYHGRKSFKLE